MAQGSHASLMGYLAVLGKDRGLAEEWLASGEKKVVLRVAGEDALLEVHRRLRRERIPCALVHDAGLTQIPAGSATALCAGPWQEEELDRVTGSLKLL